MYVDRNYFHIIKRAIPEGSMAKSFLTLGNLVQHIG